MSLSSTVLAPGLRSWPTASREAADWAAAEKEDSGDVGLAVELVKTSSATCAPSWPLRTMVASNPLAGLRVSISVRRPRSPNGPGEPVATCQSPST